MAWTKPLTAEELIGMGAEDLKGRLDSAASKDDVSGLKSQVDGLTSMLGEIQEGLKRLSTPPPPPEPAVADDDPTTQVLTDPTEFIRKQTQPIQDVALQARADIQEMRARSQYAGVFEKYGDELMKAAGNAPLNQRARDDFWNGLVRMAIGDKYVKGEITPTGYPSLLAGSAFAPSVTREADPNKGFDPEVSAWLKSRNVPLDSAAKIHKLMVEQGEPISLENYKGVN